MSLSGLSVAVVSRFVCWFGFGLSFVCLFCFVVFVFWLFD